MFRAGCNVPKLVGGNWQKISLYFSNTDTTSYYYIVDHIGRITMFKTIHKQNYPLLLVLPYSNQDRQCCRQLYHHGHTFSTKSDYTGLYFSTLYSSRIQSLQSFIINTLHGDHYKHVINGTYSGEHDRSVIQGNLLIA